ncbi:hypothetical protein GCM10022224_018160 [Nonomuraea antimicrobica]|uniref:Uncharacterized protein n=1 Tax=Nonomuraea antimicrobica TaxID=561173 RepID=A0ABP7BD37_9ACTN
MTALRALACGMDAPPQEGEFEVRYVAEGGGLLRISLNEAGAVRFEVASPAQGFVSYKRCARYLRPDCSGSQHGPRCPCQ